MSAYDLQGTLLDVCQCGVPCPCWLGEAPDEGEHHAINAYHVEGGRVGQVDVSGLDVVDVVFVPGPVLSPAWRVVRLLDERASEVQRDALLRVFRGDLGGWFGELSRFVAGEPAVEIVPIAHDVERGAGSLSIPDVVEVTIEPIRGPDGSGTTLRDGTSVASPGMAAWVSRASRHVVNLPHAGMVWEYRGRSALQAEWSVGGGQT